MSSQEERLKIRIDSGKQTTSGNPISEDLLRSEEVRDTTKITSKTGIASRECWTEEDETSESMRFN